MRLTIDQHDLQSALSVVSRAVKGHPTLPSLGGVLLRSEGNRLRLTGTYVDEEGFRYIVLPVKLGDGAR